MVVDFQHHYTPPELLELDIVKGMSINKSGKTPPYRVPSELIDLDAHVRDMDQAGIDHAVLSCGLGMDGTTLEVCKLVNDAMARACVKNTQRFSMVAHCPPLGGPAALSELERCKGEFDVKGVVIVSEPDGLPLDARELDPFWERCQSLGLYVFVHPALRPNVGELMDRYDLMRSLGREFSMATATVRLIDGGVLDRFPGLRVQMGHLAGGLAVSMARVRGIQDRERMGTSGHPVHGGLPKLDFDSYLRHRLLFDTAGVFGSMTAVNAALDEFSSASIVFGTDYPLEIRDAKEMSQFVTDLKAIGSKGEAILQGNVSRLN